MKILSDIHTHTSFCDGNCTAEDIVTSAIARGFRSIGISGHAYTPIDDSYCMSVSATEQYIQEVTALASRFKDRIDVLLGTEYDIYSAGDLSKYDYVIWSVHYVKKDEEYFPVDASEELMRRIIDEKFAGDGLALCECYFESFASLCDIDEAKIVGHFDLVAKYNESAHFFDEASPRYKNAAMRAIELLVSRGKIFEVNTGGMLRAGKSVPYPAPPLLRHISKLGGKIILTSDSHSQSSLGYKFDEVASLARECGFDRALILTRSGFEECVL